MLLLLLLLVLKVKKHVVLHDHILTNVSIGVGVGRVLDSKYCTMIVEWGIYLFFHESYFSLCE